MNGRLYRLVRDLHLAFGLFLSPFILVFAVSVFYLVHSWLPRSEPDAAARRAVTNLPLPANLGALSGRPLIDALRPALDRAGVHGEVGYVQHRQKPERFVVPVMVPGRTTTVTIDVGRREASVLARDTRLADALVELHKAPGPHLADIRMNWGYMRVWRWLADATVYGVLFISVSGIYLWFVLRSERRTGLIVLASGLVSFVAIVYGLLH